jgi:hypothetical protein
MVLVVHILAQGVHNLALGVRMLARGVHMLARGARTLEWEDDKAQVCDMLGLAEDDMAQVRGILVLDEVGHKDLKWNYNTEKKRLMILA